MPKKKEESKIDWSKPLSGGPKPKSRSMGVIDRLNKQRDVKSVPSMTEDHKQYRDDIRKTK